MPKSKSATRRAKKPTAAELERKAVRATWNHGVCRLHDGIELLKLLVPKCEENQALFAIIHVFKSAQANFDQLDNVVAYPGKAVQS